VSQFEAASWGDIDQTIEVLEATGCFNVFDFKGLHSGNDTITRSLGTKQIEVFEII